MLSRLMRRTLRPVEPPVFTDEDEQYVLQHAYVPEHVASLMIAISAAHPLRLEQYIGYTKDNWLIFVGYPLEGQFDQENCGRIIIQTREKYRPRRLLFIGPQVPEALLPDCTLRQSDVYFRLDLDAFTPRSALRKDVARAAGMLQVKQETRFTSDHQALLGEFMRRQPLPPLVAALYQSVPQYLERAPGACMLTARDSDGHLAALFVVDQAAPGFDTYLLGCYSQIHYFPRASDLLFSDMIARARQQGKPVLQLGLGVSEGIRRFKEKWGGRSFLPYEFCECSFAAPPGLAWLDTWMEGKI